MPQGVLHCCFCTKKHLKVHSLPVGQVRVQHERLQKDQLRQAAQLLLLTMPDVFQALLL